MDTSCTSCRWWEAETASAMTGDCRRYPPGGGHRHPDREHERTWAGAEWPNTLNSDWCGEHQGQIVDLTK